MATACGGQAGSVRGRRPRAAMSCAKAAGTCSVDECHPHPPARPPHLVHVALDGGLHRGADLGQHRVADCRGGDGGSGAGAGSVRPAARSEVGCAAGCGAPHCSRRAPAPPCRRSPPPRGAHAGKLTGEGHGAQRRHDAKGDARLRAHHLVGDRRGVGGGVVACGRGGAGRAGERGRASAGAGCCCRRRCSGMRAGAQACLPAVPPEPIPRPGARTRVDGERGGGDGKAAGADGADHVEQAQLVDGGELRGGDAGRRPGVSERSAASRAATRPRARARARLAARVCAAPRAPASRTHAPSHPPGRRPAGCSQTRRSTPAG